jgi:hypothetical protein
MCCDELLRFGARAMTNGNGRDQDRRVPYVHEWSSNDALERNSSSIRGYSFIGRVAPRIVRCIVTKLARIDI